MLAALAHLYVHSHPDDANVKVPQSIGVPLLQISRFLQIPPILTYSDTVLYNWTLLDSRYPVSESNIAISTVLSSTPDEAHFYLTSALIELKGVKGLDLMRSAMNEAFIGDATAVKRITEYLESLAAVIAELTDILSNVKTTCSPDVFFSKIRPWLRGSDANRGGLWHFENADKFGFAQPEELSGPSAGQSALVHSLDIFLGIHKLSHAMLVAGQERPFLERMKLYIPRHHRAFLNHLEKEPQIRELVHKSQSIQLSEAYNKAVHQMKLFRDEHIRIAALYIISPARACRMTEEQKGTGGSDIMPFLKAVRDRTQDSLILNNQSENSI